MMNFYSAVPKPVSALVIAVALSACGGGGGGGDNGAPNPPVVTPAPTPAPAPAFETRAALGESLFSDKNLSLNRSQSCATCHDPARAFTDSRLDANGQITAVSLGDDGISRGDRNSPSAAYARFSPRFGTETHPRFNSQQPDYEGFVGGQFWDGRAADLKAHAGEPPIGPKEMGMANKAAVVERLLENSDYEISFKAIFGDDIFDDVDAAYAAMTESIAAFEEGEAFASFDSKYDRSLRGEYTFQPGSKESLGRALFFSAQFTNCATCHQLRPNGNNRETFTSYEYHNIGVPVNVAVRAINGIDENAIDDGLLANPNVTAAAERGKYKVPTLRNIAVTEPYMHNGIYRNLETVIKFYDKFQTNSRFPINPETGEAWLEPQLPDTMSLDELRDGRRMTQNDVEAMVCFLRTLTDARYENLIEDKGIDCSS